MNKPITMMLGWCIRCMTWVETATGFCPICGATTLNDCPLSLAEIDALDRAKDEKDASDIL